MKKLLISFSGGETSAFMTQWLIKHFGDQYDIQVVFANTGQENEETLIFVQKCSDYFKVPVVWVEAVFHKGRKGTTHKIVNINTAHRGNKIFDAMCEKYGISNQSLPHCTRELKERPITSYVKSLGWKTYYTAIGIRADEMDRINKKWKEKKFVYPLVHSNMVPMTKEKINFWWNQQPFRLNLKGWQGNCKTCWKKSLNKLYKIAQETPEHFVDFRELEQKYEYYTPESRLKKMRSRGEEPNTPYRFFRGNKSTEDIIRESKNFNRSVADDAQRYENLMLYDVDLVGGESCEVFSGCE